MDGPLTFPGVRPLSLMRVAVSQVVEICRHLFDLGDVMLLDLLDEARIVRQNKVDRGSLATKPTSTSNTMDVVFLLDGQLVVDD